jgi:hypothetical protein
VNQRRVKLFASEPRSSANPLPASPASVASIVALSASRLVCSAMVVINLTTPPIRFAASGKLRANTGAGRNLGKAAIGSALGVDLFADKKAAPG